MGDEDEMNIVHVVSSLDVSSGGPSKSVSELAIEQAQLGAKVTIITRKSSDPFIDSSPHKNLALKFLSRNVSGSDLKRYASVKETDVYHGHGIWEMPVHRMAKYARNYGKPYILSPRGMLEPWSLNQGWLKKMLALKFYQRYDLQNASCIHTTAINEAANVRNLGITTDIVIIPNGVQISEVNSSKLPINKGKKTVLFISRIHPKKGLEHLINAWALLDETSKQGWNVVIVGDGDTTYVKILKSLISKYNLDTEISIVGPKYGDEKHEVLSTASIFVLPTYSENFGVVVAEALSYGIPVITTKGAPWEDLQIHNAGWWVDIGVDSLVDALQTALRMSDSQRQQMGQNGQELVRQKYDIRTVAKQSLQLYNWIISGGPAPDFMYDKSRPVDIS